MNIETRLRELKTQIKIVENSNEKVGLNLDLNDCVFNLNKLLDECEEAIEGEELHHIVRIIVKNLSSQLFLIRYLPNFIKIIILLIFCWLDHLRSFLLFSCYFGIETKCTWD